jgi:hypothetical protein
MGTPLHVAAFARQHDATRALPRPGPTERARKHRYDRDDRGCRRRRRHAAGPALGGKATNVTSRYDGTAPIAAAHLGHDEVVAR